MSELSAFFKEPHTAFGVFYPMHCIVAVLSDLGLANRTRAALMKRGFLQDEVLAIDGMALVDLEKEETTLGGAFMQMLSRGLGCEQISTDQNLTLAAEGDALLIVQCKSRDHKDKAWAVIETANPAAAQYYERLGVESLSGGLDTT
jgi:hypothetical protein